MSDFAARRRRVNEVRKRLDPLGFAGIDAPPADDDDARRAHFHRLRETIYDLGDDMGKPIVITFDPDGTCWVFAEMRQN